MKSDNRTTDLPTQADFLLPLFLSRSIAELYGERSVGMACKLEMQVRISRMCMLRFDSVFVFVIWLNSLFLSIRSSSFSFSISFFSGFFFVHSCVHLFACRLFFGNRSVLHVYAEVKKIRSQLFPYRILPINTTLWFITMTSCKWI